MKSINKVVFIGSKKLGLEVLREMTLLAVDSLIGVITIDDTKDSRSMFNEISEFCSRNNIELYIVKNRRRFRKVLLKLEPELCVVCCWYWLISKKILNSVPKGFLGIHNSLLPKYRGGSPLVWQIIRGEKKVGVSIFSLADDMDAGGIWGQEIVEVTSEDYIKDVLKKVEEKVVNWFRIHYIQILNGSLNSIPQDHSHATYCAQRFPFDGEINWRKTSIEIYNFIRAQSKPYPGAFTYYRGKKVIVWRAHLLNMIYYGEPGQVARVSQDGVYVICGDQKPIILKDVQMEDEPTRTAIDVIKSIKIRF